MSERDPVAWKAVYEATNPAELAAAYADWSQHYDRRSGCWRKAGFFAPSWWASRTPLIKAFVFEVL